MRPHRVERAHDEPVAAGRANRVVEVAVGSEAPGAPLRQACEPPDVRALLARRPHRRELGRSGLEHLAQLVQLAHVRRREAQHERAAPRDEPHEAFVLEQVQRFAHGRARTPSSAAILLLDARIRAQAAPRDGLAQRGMHPIGELLLSSRAASGTPDTVSNLARSFRA